MKKELPEKKMTLDEYQEKYTNPENMKAAKTFLFIFASAIGIIIAACLFFVVLRLFDIHPIAGYVGIVGAVVIFTVAYIAPVIKLKNTKSFMTNVSSANARQAQKYNKQLREDIADKMIDLSAKTEGITWYSEDHVGKLAIARHTKNDTDLKKILSDIYTSDVKNAANKLIRKSAIKVGITTAISQSDKIDTLFVVVYDLNLIKDIVYLYGYRPSDTQMAKIYRTVLTNALMAYGVNNATAGVGRVIISKTLSEFTSFIPIAGTVVESGIQGVVNSILTTYIGYQTKKYLVKEYHLQEMLDNIDLIDSEEEQATMIESIKEEVKENLTKKAKHEKPAPSAV